MRTIRDSITLDELRQMASPSFENLVKAVIDVEREIIALDAELHSDLETALLQDGSHQKSLWGIKLYPELPADQFIEFDSLINIRPSQGNRSRGVEDENIRKGIVGIVAKRIKR